MSDKRNQKRQKKVFYLNKYPVEDYIHRRKRRKYPEPDLNDYPYNCKGLNEFGSHMFDGKIYPGMFDVPENLQF